MKRYDVLMEVCLVTTSSWSVTVMAMPQLDAYEVNVAGAGGDFNSRTATFRVPDRTTTTSIGDGLRLYEAHIGKMIELTNHFCQDREPKYIIYWNYEADEGRVFMGEFPLSCQFARETVQTFGMGATETVTINIRDTPIQETITTLSLDKTNSQPFVTLVQTLVPQCIDTVPKICPGDRLE